MGSSLYSTIRVVVGVNTLSEEEEEEEEEEAPVLDIVHSPHDDSTLSLLLISNR